MSHIEDDIRSLREKAGRVSSMSCLTEDVDAFFRNHAGELSNENVSFRLNVKDKGMSYSARISQGSFQQLSEEEAVDVELTATDADFLGLFSGKLSAPLALMFGKVKVKGNLHALSPFARFL